jgi:hypothetical protein
LWNKGLPVKDHRFLAMPWNLESRRGSNLPQSSPLVLIPKEHIAEVPNGPLLFYAERSAKIKSRRG